MTLSIIMPVSGRGDLAYQSLSALVPTLSDAGNVELIVIDNTPARSVSEYLAEFPTAQIVKSRTDLGWAVAANIGARMASGDALCFFSANIVAQHGWIAVLSRRLEASVGAVGARLLFPDGTIQNAGVVTAPSRFGYEGFRPYNMFERWASSTPASRDSADMQIVTRDCFLTPRNVFHDLDGFDEALVDGFEDIDYCLRLRERGLRVIYEPKATLHYIDSTVISKPSRRFAYNQKTVSRRHCSQIEPDHNRFWPWSGRVYREALVGAGRGMTAYKLAPVSVIMHGKAVPEPQVVLRHVLATRLPIDELLWIADGPAPTHETLTIPGQPALEVVQSLLSRRGDRYYAFINIECQLRSGWLEELINAIEFGCEVAASTMNYDAATGLEPLAADARCTLLNLRDVPMHVRFSEVDSLDGAIVDLTWQAVRLGLGVRAVRTPIALLPAPVQDARFAIRHGMTHEELRQPNSLRLEQVCADQADLQTFTSIIILSWNTPQHVWWAVDSIRAFTRSAYEIIIVDNGSGPETLSMLKHLADVNIIYNERNMGFAFACNQGIAASSGTHVVLLNSDVVVTEGWLERLLDAQRRDPLIGMTGPRTNYANGQQQLAQTSYGSLERMHEFAHRRRKEFAGIHYRANRASGFCLCIARVVIEEVGGLDTRYGIGHLADDDYCVRVRAAGYQIAICEDVFIHHYGKVSFTSNNVDYLAHLESSWKLFATRWGLAEQTSSRAYETAMVIGREFERSRDYIPFRTSSASETKRTEARPKYDIAFLAVIDSESTWSKVSPIVMNYIAALSIHDSALFSLASLREPTADAIRARISRAYTRLQLDSDTVPAIEVCDIETTGIDRWISTIPAEACLRVAKDDRLGALDLAKDRSPSGFLRSVRGATQ